MCSSAPNLDIQTVEVVVTKTELFVSNHSTEIYPFTTLSQTKDRSVQEDHTGKLNQGS